MIADRAILAVLILIDLLIKWIRHFSGSPNDPFKAR
jgi:hypothetical protein